MGSIHDTFTDDDNINKKKEKRFIPKTSIWHNSLNGISVSFSFNLTFNPWSYEFPTGNRQWVDGVFRQTHGRCKVREIVRRSYVFFYRLRHSWSRI